MPKITVREIKERYLSNSESQKNFIWTFYVRRPVSYYLAWPFLKFGISATVVTICWLFIAVMGCAFIASGGYVNMIIGTALLELAVIFDCVDGHIARFTRITHTGHILDMWAGEILLVSGILSIGIGLSNSSDLVSAKFIQPLFVFDRITFTYIGLFGALAALSAWTAKLHWRTIGMKMSLGDKELEYDVPHSKKMLVVHNLFHYIGALTMLMFISAILNVLDLMLILISAVYGLHLIALMNKIMKRARSLDSVELTKQ